MILVNCYLFSFALNLLGLGRCSSTDKLHTIFLICPFLSDTISGIFALPRYDARSCSIYLKNYSSARDSSGPHAIMCFGGRIIALINAL